MDNITTIKARDIKCQGCASSVRAAVKALNGVKTVDVDLPNQTVTITHDQQANRSDFVRVLTSSGFPAE